MSEVRDLAIKLFRRNISLKDSQIPSASEQDSDSQCQTPSSIPPVMVIQATLPIYGFSFLILFFGAQHKFLSIFGKNCIFCMVLECILSN